MTLDRQSLEHAGHGSITETLHIGGRTTVVRVSLDGTRIVYELVTGDDHESGYLWFGCPRDSDGREKRLRPEVLAVVREAGLQLLEGRTS